MKKLLTALLISVAAIATPACAKEEPKAAPETKKVCVDVKDKNGAVQKDAKGNPKQKCMTVKVHKKLDGTKVPDKKK